MSKIGVEPVKFDAEKVTVTVEKGGEYGNVMVTVKGPNGELTESIRNGINVEVKDSEVIFTRAGDEYRAYHGLYRALVANMVTGVVDGFEKTLEIHGVGYRGSAAGNKLTLTVGFSHAIEFEVADDVTVAMPDETTIVIKGADKQRVGFEAARVRELRKPEPYKGKGIRYAGEQVRRKAGKSAG